MRTAIAILVAAAVAFTAGPSLALEKTSARMIDKDDWSASATGTILYYNYCTGWIWVWSGWSPGEALGVNYTATGCVSQFLNTSWALTYSGIPAGYGFTGTIAVLGGHTCAAPILAAQPYLPPVTSGWSSMNWGGMPVPSMFSLQIFWMAPSGFTNGTGLASDHPLAGPTGPQACGTCYPTTRASNSRYYGIAGAYCPSGTTLSDGLCDIEFVMDVNILCTVGVEDESWGKIKNLYR
jgi:hypothetical protein